MIVPLHSSLVTEQDLVTKKEKEREQRLVNYAAHFSMAHELRMILVFLINGKKRRLNLYVPESGGHQDVVT